MKTVPITVSVRDAASQDSSPLGLAAWPTRQVYEAAGVRLKAPAMLLLRVAPTLSFSKTGGEPLTAVQLWNGPGIAFRYQVSQAGCGGVSGGIDWSSRLAQTLSALEHGVCQAL